MLPQNHIYMGKWQIHATMMLPIFVSNVCIPTTPFSIAFRNAWKAMAAHMLATLGKACNIIFGSIALEISMRHSHWLLLGCRAPRHLLRSMDGCGKGTNSLWFQLESVHGAKKHAKYGQQWGGRQQIGSALVSRYGFRWLGANIPLSNFEKNLAAARPALQTNTPTIRSLGKLRAKKKLKWSKGW